uniref:Uncharacterized protein n=1 Tax=Oryza sativa subsp. japonica TaxID=39947 RepID=Q6ZC10_ORYSJ|nr:hypothetical protein [Oryza sativa Japonica Group]
MAADSAWDPRGGARGQRVVWLATAAPGWRRAGLGQRELAGLPVPLVRSALAARGYSHHHRCGEEGRCGGDGVTDAVGKRVGVLSLDDDGDLGIGLATADGVSFTAAAHSDRCAAKRRCPGA